MRWLLAALFWLGVLPAATQAETLVATAMSRGRIDITSNFTGADLAVFGSVERDAATIARAGGYDIVVTVRGLRGAGDGARKAVFEAFEAQRGCAVLIATPSFVSVLSNRPLADIAAGDIRDKLRIGVDTMVTAQGDRRKAVDNQEPDFRSALGHIATTKACSPTMKTRCGF